MSAHFVALGQLCEWVEVKNPLPFCFVFFKSVCLSLLPVTLTEDAPNIEAASKLKNCYPIQLIHFESIDTYLLPHRLFF